MKRYKYEVNYDVLFKNCRTLIICPAICNRLLKMKREKKRNRGRLCHTSGTWMKIKVSLEWLYTSLQKVGLYQPTALKVVWAAPKYLILVPLTQLHTKSVAHFLGTAETISGWNFCYIQYSDVNEITIHDDS